MSADLSASLTVLCCTANLGNAKPTSQDMAAWIPPRGVLPNQDKKDTPSLTKPMDIIVIGMQEATWKTGASSSTKPEDRKDSSWSEYDSEEEDLVTTASATPAAAVSSSTPIATTTTATTSASPKTKKGNLALPAPAVPQILTTQISSLDAALTGMKQPDAVYLRDTLQETLGGDKDYQLVKEFQRGQMRLYLYCRPQWVNEITELDVKAENTGIAHVYHNKGGIVLQFNVGRTRLSFLTAHLAAHEGVDKYKTRNDNLREILRGARPNPKHLQGYDAPTVSHHMFIMGDLNYRVRITGVDDSASHEAKVARANELIQAGDFESLYAMDELSQGLAKNEFLCQFQTPPCHFSPTFKMLRQPGFSYKTKRIPSYTDRILYASAEHLPGNLQTLLYEPCPDFSSSDHKPIRGAFAINLNACQAGTENEMTQPVSLLFRNISCKDLPPMDVDGSSDPYVVFACDPPQLVRDERSPKERKGKEFTIGNMTWPATTYLKKNLNPSWTEHVKLHVPSVAKSELVGGLLLLTVMDYDMASQDDTICVLQLNLSELISLQEGEAFKTVQISRPLLKYGRSRGSIEFTVDVRQEESEHGTPVKGKRGLLSRISKQWSKRKSSS